MKQKLLTPAEFHLIYNVSHTTFYREVNAGRLSIIKIGSATRILIEAADAWLDARIQNTPRQVAGT